ncbi:uncharacterized protein LOC130975099 [Arachis stenosperma]|uniref:uncharacterized protein LOC130975099 n=1 Tax=Arachis stenosperma TaxID=217475 RepID=UPI0025ACD1FF|nr:uncharacterized protein LOC130975099 [Arachis stenosperma]
MGATPSYHSILEVRLSKYFDKPTDMRYDGTQDPQEHLMAFESRMNLEGVVDEVRCRAFPVTLAEPGIRWFNALPQGSVRTFADITRGFLVQFTTCIKKAKHRINLLGVTQRNGEPTIKYLDRFNDECLEIDGLTDSMASLCLTNGLLNEDFRKYLTTKTSVDNAGNPKCGERIHQRRRGQSSGGGQQAAARLSSYSSDRKRGKA